MRGWIRAKALRESRSIVPCSLPFMISPRRNRHRQIPSRLRRKQPRPVDRQQPRRLERQRHRQVHRQPLRQFHQQPDRARPRNLKPWKGPNPKTAISRPRPQTRRAQTHKLSLALASPRPHQRLRPADSLRSRLRRFREKTCPLHFPRLEERHTKSR